MYSLFYKNIIFHNKHLEEKKIYNDRTNKN